MDKGISPEEKLLKLIRGKSKKTSDDKASVDIPVEKKNQINHYYLRPVDNFLKTKLAPLLDFKTLNMFLILLSVMLLIYFLLIIASPIKGRIMKISESVKANELKEVELKINQPKDYDYYYQQFSKRDIFNAPLLEKTSEGSVLSTSLQEATKNLKLVGIILDEEPQAIIEDTSTKTTHFLNKGDSLNKLEIKDILESKVIFIYGSEEFELEL